MQNKISSVTPYNQNWPNDFISIKNMVYPLLKDLIIGFEHVGSTSVPGLAAKPIIDIDVIYERAENLPKIIQAMESLDYKYEGDKGIKDRESFKAPAKYIKQHFYVCKAGSLALKNHLILRDHLKSHLPDCVQYGKLKIEIAHLYNEFPELYMEKKTSFILNILKKYDMLAKDLDKIKAVNSSKKKVLIPLPRQDFDPTEVGVPWQVLNQAGVDITFATPNGEIAYCDFKMLDGRGLGILAALLAADSNGRSAYTAMVKSSEFINPISWAQSVEANYDGLILPGGHAKGMREYLESIVLQKLVSHFFAAQKPVGAICHGVVLAARSTSAVNGKSVLWGKKTTALLSSQELIAWGLTCLWLGNYYRTYPQTVESEVKAVLKNSKNDFLPGPLPLNRDSTEKISDGFVVEDGNYISARWPGDAHNFAQVFLKRLKL